MAETNKGQKDLSDVENYILSSIQEIKYGAVEIVIHDSKIVQVEKSEKVRFGQI